MVLNRLRTLFTRMTQGAGNCLGKMTLTSDPSYMLKQTCDKQLVNVYNKNCE